MHSVIPNHAGDVVGFAQQFTSEDLVTLFVGTVARVVCRDALQLVAKVSVAVAEQLSLWALCDVTQMRDGEIAENET